MHRSYPDTLYTIFELAPSASYELLHARWRELSAAWHPDRPGGGDEARYKQLQEAWATLKSTTARARYDAQLVMGGGACAVCDGAGTRLRTVSFTRYDKVVCEACEGTGRRAL
jgi:curved DNA-binding protein